MGSDMTPRKDRRFKQWNKTKLTPLANPRNSNSLPPIEAFTYDLSIGGARIHTADSFEVGTLLRLQIALARTGEILRVEGVVKWRRKDEAAAVYEMGVEFQHTSMVTVLSLMRNLHDGSRTPASTKIEPAEAGLGRS